jgi:ascorbate-specific PTS system EIIC-type component UlaA
MVVLSLIAGVYAIKGAIAIKDNPSYGSDNDLQTAHEYLTIASVVCFVTLAIMILLIVLYIIFGSETIMVTGSWVSLGLMFVSCALAITIGILCAIAAVDMKKSSNYTGQGQDYAAYTDSIISTFLGLGLFGLLIIGFIGYGIYSYQRAQEEAKLKLQVQTAETKVQTLDYQQALEAKKLEILQEQQKEFIIKQQLKQSGSMSYTP